MAQHTWHSRRLAVSTRVRERTANSADQHAVYKHTSQDLSHTSRDLSNSSQNLSHTSQDLSLQHTPPATLRSRQPSPFPLPSTITMPKKKKERKSNLPHQNKGGEGSEMTCKSIHADGEIMGEASICASLSLICLDAAYPPPHHSIHHTPHDVVSIPPHHVTPHHSHVTPHHSIPHTPPDVSQFDPKTAHLSVGPSAP